MTEEFDTEVKEIVAGKWYMDTEINEHVQVVRVNKTTVRVKFRNGEYSATKAGFKKFHEEIPPEVEVVRKEILIHKLMKDGKLLDWDVSQEYNDWICLNDQNGHQFDSCEAYYADQWAKKYGLTVEVKKVMVEI